MTKAEMEEALITLRISLKRAEDQLEDYKRQCREAHRQMVDDVARRNCAEYQMRVLIEVLDRLVNREDD